MKRILITRPQPGAAQTAARLTALGFLPVVTPLLTIIQRDVRVPDSATATVLTSRNAVAACPPSMHDRPVFVVGAATATQAVEAGFKNVFNADGDAEALASLIINTLSPSDGPLFMPTGLGQGASLAEVLRQHGFRVLRRIAYQAKDMPVLPEGAATHLRQGLLTAAMFFSGETSRIFVRLVRAAKLADAVGNIEAVSISEPAAMPLRALPWRRISVAAKPNQDAMLVLLT